MFHKYCICHQACTTSTCRIRMTNIRFVTTQASADQWCRQKMIPVWPLIWQKAKHKQWLWVNSSNIVRRSLARLSMSKRLKRLSLRKPLLLTLWIKYPPIEYQPLHSGTISAVASPGEWYVRHLLWSGSIILLPLWGATVFTNEILIASCYPVWLPSWVRKYACPLVLQQDTRRQHYRLPTGGSILVICFPKNNMLKLTIS